MSGFIVVKVELLSHITFNKSLFKFDNDNILVVLEYLFNVLNIPVKNLINAGEYLCEISKILAIGLI